MPMSVIMPVAWVVRMRAPEILVIVAFCIPMMKHRQASEKTRPGSDEKTPPLAKQARNAPCTAMGRAYCRRARRSRAQLIRTVLKAAPATKAPMASIATTAIRNCPATRLSASCDRYPVMCEV